MTEAGVRVVLVLAGTLVAVVGAVYAWLLTEAATASWLSARDGTPRSAGGVLGEPSLRSVLVRAALAAGCAAGAAYGAVVVAAAVLGVAP